MPNPSPAPVTETGKRPNFQLPPDDEALRRQANLLRLLEQWAEEDEANPDAEREWLELKAALNANRRATGERLLFPKDETEAEGGS